MKTQLNRRDLLKALGAGGALTLAGCASTKQQAAAPQKKLGRVIVVGAGYGGATAAKYIRMWSGGNIDVTLVERNPQFVSCPISNLVIGGSRKIEDVTRDYWGLREYGVQVIIDEVTGVDPAKKTLQLRKIQDLRYDKLVIAPGVDFLFDQVKGLDAEAQKRFLHAWKAGPQTVALRKQLEDMPDGGVYAITIPRAPYRCPPGPYERACQVAWYFKNNKPKSKVIILDANEDVQSKKGLFMRAWNNDYKGLIEYRPNWNASELDAAGSTIMSDVGDKLKADVLNIIPPQRAGDIAQRAGLINANNRWCQVDWTSMESTAQKDIHVIGDALLAAPAMPKSGHMANQHGKAAAAGIVELMNGRTPAPLTMANTCYSFIDDKRVVHVASVHRYDAAQKTMVALPIAQGPALSSEANELEGIYAWSWAQTIWNDMLV
ncbi:MAG TPA: FCSD flavin-binding domain-containing protein [Burkholderiaceae bacterium]|nr:FCSD flavin-binding domain-containing protein [Burkholderiaceae bacterium]